MSGSRLFISIRSGASVSQLLAVSRVPRGARMTGRLSAEEEAIVRGMAQRSRGAWVLWDIVVLSGSIGPGPPGGRDPAGGRPGAEAPIRTTPPLRLKAAS